MTHALVKVFIAGALISTVFGMGPTFAKSVNQTVGETWQTQCKSAGSRYGCCKNKEKKCIDSGTSTANCGSRYRQCVKKVEFQKLDQNEALSTNPAAKKPEKKPRWQRLQLNDANKIAK